MAIVQTERKRYFIMLVNVVHKSPKGSILSWRILFSTTKKMQLTITNHIFFFYVYDVSIMVETTCIGHCKGLDSVPNSSDVEDQCSQNKQKRNFLHNEQSATS